MRQVVIYRSLIHANQVLATKDGTTDYLGQLISTMYPNQQLVDLKLPSQTKKLLHPFTISIRRSILDSPLTISILQVSSLPRKDAEEAIIGLMAKFQYQVIFE
jgi:hypothetical protein